MAAEINAADLTPEQLRELGLKPPRQTKFTSEDVCRYALRCLAVLAPLTVAERERVLRHALRVNKVRPRSPKKGA